MWESLASQLEINPWLIAILIVWSLFWKGLALWKSAKLNQQVWFIILLVINTLGILELLYLFIFSYHASPRESQVKNKHSENNKSPRKKR